MDHQIGKMGIQASNKRLTGNCIITWAKHQQKAQEENFTEKNCGTGKRKERARDKRRGRTKEFFFTDRYSLTKRKSYASSKGEAKLSKEKKLGF